MADDGPSLTRRELVTAASVGVGFTAGCTDGGTETDDSSEETEIRVGYGGVPVESTLEQAVRDDSPDEGEDDDPPSNQGSSPPPLGSGGGSDDERNVEYGDEDYGVVGYGEGGYGGAVVVEE